MSSMPPVWRSLLFVPANNSKFIDKAHSCAADCIILDLEDSVPGSELEAARAGLREAVASVSRNGADVLVRINHCEHLSDQDIHAGVFNGVTAIMLPKVRNRLHVQSVCNAISQREKAESMRAGAVRLVPMIETANAYFQALQIAEADPRNIALNLGGEDFAADVNMRPDVDTLALPKQQIVIAARAAGLIPLGLMGTVADFQDLKGIRQAAEKARRFGVEGASCVHPSNVPILNTAFSPSKIEVQHAKKLINKYEEALVTGKGAFRFNGKMIDLPAVRRAQMLLKRWAAIEARQARH